MYIKDNIHILKVVLMLKHVFFLYWAPISNYSTHKLNVVLIWKHNIIIILFFTSHTNPTRVNINVMKVVLIYFLCVCVTRHTYPTKVNIKAVLIWKHNCNVFIFIFYLAHTSNNSKHATSFWHSIALWEPVHKVANEFVFKDFSTNNFFFLSLWDDSTVNNLMLDCQKRLNVLFEKHTDSLHTLEGAIIIHISC